MLFLVNNGTYFNYVYDNKRFQDFRIYMEMGVLHYFRGTQREYSSKPLKHSIVKRISVFKR